MVKFFIEVTVAAILIGVIVAVVQKLLLGSINPAITGGISGAAAAGYAVARRPKPPQDAGS